MSTVVGFAHIGPERHGVRRHGELIASGVAELAPVAEVTVEPGADLGSRLDAALDPGRAPVWHLQFSDHLVSDGSYGPETLEELGRRRARRRLVVTLHDLPGVGHDDAARDRTRTSAYARVVDAVDTVVVASEHERRAVCRFRPTAPVRLVPLPVEHRCLPPPRPPGPVPTVGILGFVYPGKGHASVLRACARFDGPVEVVAGGGPSDGHDDLVADLSALADRLGVAWRATGWLSRQEQGRWLVDTDVPVVAHPAPSASGSLAAWLSARRSPLVADNPYAAEIARTAPGAVRRYDPHHPTALRDAIAAAIAAPATTLLADEAVLVPYAPVRVASAHLDLYRT